MKLKSLTGFTLLEIMSGVAIVGLCSALTIPNIVRMRVDVNEAALQTSLKAVQCDMEAYRLANGSYPPISRSFILPRSAIPNGDIRWNFPQINTPIWSKRSPKNPA